MPRPILIAILVPFSILTTLALWTHGYWGIFKPQLESLAGGQVLLDLAIALTLVLIWMWQDAKAKGRNIWPWIAITLLAGSFGPLLYLLTAKDEA